MNIAKNMEIIFVAATVLAAATSFATAADTAVAPAAPAAKAAKVAVSSAKMQVVTVTAKRLTAAEKAAL